MDALLANYASDDEEESNPHQKSSSLPYPASLHSSGKSSSSRASSLFSSLPPPKEGSGRDSSGDPMKTEGSLQVRVSDHRSKFEDKSGSAFSGKKNSLFSALPPPRSSNTFPEPSLKPEPLTRGSKRVVEFRPAINISSLKEEDDDDEEESRARAKRLAADSDKSRGLAAILPKPKYTGSSLGLGSGHSSSGRMALEINDDHSKKKEAIFAESIMQPEKNDVRPEGIFSSHITTNDVRPNPDNGVPISSAQFNGHSTKANQPPVGVDFPNDMNVGSSMGAWANYSSDYPQGLQTNEEQSQWMTYNSDYPQGVKINENESQWATSLTSHDACVQSEEYSGMPIHDYHATMAHEAMQGVETTEDPLANILMKERRKGGKHAPPTVIEVKQSELTVNKVREDQVRATGIAFGPAYQPVSTKGKPSKLHRRKHQIGTLYFDMKQKEMELAERRSRGFMSKSETQAKYGW